MPSSERNCDFVLAGNINLDFIPAFIASPGAEDSWSATLVPGKLIEVGPAVLSTGGSVANTGLALRRLGHTASLFARIADDDHGRAIRDLLDRQAPGASDHLILSASGSTSYTIVMSPPGMDRLFLHGPGVNDQFTDADVPLAPLSGCKIFHFGYPPVMRRMYAEQGRELEALFRKAKGAGAVTSLDMSKPDPQSTSGKVDWRTILERVLPFTDLFLPSFEEILFMLRRECYEDLERTHGCGNAAKGQTLGIVRELAGEMIAYGCAVAGIKLGDQGFYLRTASDTSRLAPLKSKLGLDDAEWTGRELLSPCFETAVAGTTGAGDCTIAGFLAGLARGQSPRQALTSAVAVGACSTEHPDATSGIPPWESVQRRIDAGWPRIVTASPGFDWRRDEEFGLWVGSLDGGFGAA
ncbi:carbohydrate kinase family protein [Cohnella candidum]|uniref:Carbohydrate kinase family protein n=1 Tax=Cohnella candidum TaxID=2674991 RepID=A0A3G3K617_9BACL|nr:carbohydrate kinase family protein [Cohnella candidum]AYQ75219.1 carbohydrate kinase family protein [Cohnella candidum]